MDLPSSAIGNIPWILHASLLLRVMPVSRNFTRRKLGTFKCRITCFSRQLMNLPAVVCSRVERTNMVEEIARFICIQCIKWYLFLMKFVRVIPCINFQRSRGPQSKLQLSHFAPAPVSKRGGDDLVNMKGIELFESYRFAKEKRKKKTPHEIHH